VSDTHATEFFERAATSRPASEATGPVGRSMLAPPQLFTTSPLRASTISSLAAMRSAPLVDRAGVAASGPSTPSWPKLFRPQHQTSPPALRPQPALSLTASSAN